MTMTWEEKSAEQARWLAEEERIEQERIAHKMTHTPGPWTFVRDGTGQMQIAGPEAIDSVTEARYDFLASIASRSGVRYKSGTERPVDASEDAANARLIAAAPDLLEALTLAEDVIRGARDTFVERSMPGGPTFTAHLAIIRAAIDKATT